MQAQIRPARVGDGPAIARLHIESWQSAYRGLLPDEFLDHLGEDLPRRSEWWDQQIVAAAERGIGQAVSETTEGLTGFVTFGPSESEPPEPEVGELYAIDVHPDAWGRGHGRALLSYAMDGLREAGYSAAVLWVLDSNARARRFDEIAGWRPDGATKTEHRADVVLTEVRYRATL